jgi:hypothetical protein
MALTCAGEVHQQPFAVETAVLKPKRSLIAREEAIDKWKAFDQTGQSRQVDAALPVNLVGVNLQPQAPE